MKRIRTVIVIVLVIGIVGGWNTRLQAMQKSTAQKLMLFLAQTGFKRFPVDVTTGQKLLLNGEITCAQQIIRDCDRRSLLAALFHPTLLEQRLLCMQYISEQDRQHLLNPSDKKSPLYGAIEGMRPYAIERLIKAGADPNTVDKHNETVAHTWLLWYGEWCNRVIYEVDNSDAAFVFKELLQGGLDSTVPDDDGNTVAQLAHDISKELPGPFEALQEHAIEHRDGQLHEYLLSLENKD